MGLFLRSRVGDGRRSVREISERLERERDARAARWQIGWPHDAPGRPLGVYESSAQASGSGVPFQRQQRGEVMRYLARVHCCGSRWLIHVPAVEAWTLANEKRSIRSVAHQMVSWLTGDPAESLGLDLTEGRALGSVDEFASAEVFAQHWEMSPRAAIPEGRR
jgi:hypothetical protein